MTPRPAPRVVLRAALLVLGLTVACSVPARAVRVLADSLDSPVSMARAPDGRVFVCEQGGSVRVVRRSRLLGRPFLTVPAFARGEQGLLAVAFDPDFSRTRRVFVYFTLADPRPHNRVISVIASGDTALAGSERIVFDLDPHPGDLHAGGGLAFGPDGMLYVGTGEGDVGELSQVLRRTGGKILRLDPDGGPAAGNPFDSLLAGRERAVWARGLRNAFSIAVSRRTGWMLVNDVGGAGFEEVNELIPGANYGWPMVEGPPATGEFQPPFHAYPHDSGCAITGGTFYETAGQGAEAAAWQGRYLFVDLCRREIRALDPGRPVSAVAVAQLPAEGPVDLEVEPGGSILCLLRNRVSPEGGPGSARGSLVRLVPGRDFPWRPGRPRP